MPSFPVRAFMLSCGASITTEMTEMPFSRYGSPILPIMPPPYSCSKALSFSVAEVSSTITLIMATLLFSIKKSPFRGTERRHCRNQRYVLPFAVGSALRFRSALCRAVPSASGEPSASGLFPLGMFYCNIQPRLCKPYPRLLAANYFFGAAKQIFDKKKGTVSRAFSVRFY